MIRFYDTSVLVAACQGDNVFHEAAIEVLRKAAQKDSHCAAHSLAEFYSVMSRLPMRPRITPDQALLLVDNLLERFNPVTLTANEYRSTISSCGEAGLPGGSVYDALIMACARKVSADVVYTFNQRHFSTSGSGLGQPYSCSLLAGRLPKTEVRQPISREGLRGISSLR
jgi:predicted nucleic acid-binding protein